MVWKEVLFYSMRSRTQKQLLVGELGRPRIPTKKLPSRFSETAISVKINQVFSMSWAQLGWLAAE